MPNMFQFADLLEKYVNRAGYNVSQLARLSGLPPKTVANWMEGRVRKPRTQEDLLKIARVLRLNTSETTSLLQAADYPSVEELWKLMGGEKSDLLAPWADSFHQRLKKAPFQAIADLPYFVGREEELKEIKDALLTGRHVAICSLQGMGGVGKTALATHLAYQLRPYFPDGVLWARVDTSDAMSILRSFAAAYGRDVSQYTDLEGRSRVVRELLANKRTLMILDNARRSDEIKPLLPPTGSCAVIITTRYQNLFATSGALRFQIGPFDAEKEEALQLFSQTLGNKWAEQEKGILLNIAQVLGHLPLAIAIAASRLAYEPGWSAADFLQRLYQERKRLNELTYENQSVRLSANLSYELLQPQQQLFFASLGVFAGENLTIEAVAYVTELSVEEVIDNLRKLYNLSLVQVGQPGRYRLHPLLRDYAREKLETNTVKEQVIMRMVAFFVRYAESHRRDFPALDEEVDNILAALEGAFSQNMKEELVQGSMAVSHFFRTRGLYALATTHLERARGAAVSLNNPKALATVLFHLGAILRRQGRYQQAKPPLQEGLALARSLNHPELISMILGELGVVLCRHEAYSQAEAYFQEGLVLARQAGDPELICASLIYVGVRANENGNPAQAEAHYREGLTLAREHKQDERAVFFLNNLGVLAGQQENTTEAEAYFRESLALARQIGQQEIICVSLNNLGDVAQRRQDTTQAEAYFQESLALSQQMGHSNLMMLSMQNLAELATQQGKYEQALLLYQEVIKVANQSQNQAMIPSTLHGMGTVAIAQGDQAQAGRYFQESVALIEQAGTSEMFISALNSWGELFLREGMLVLATAAFHKALELAHAGQNTVWVALVNYGLARVIARQGDFASAQRQAHDSLQILEQDRHPKTAEVRQWLVNLERR